MRDQRDANMSGIGEPLGDARQNSRVGETALAESRVVIERLNRQAAALHRLAERTAGCPMVHALEALAIATEPLAAGVALHQPHSPKLRIEAAWVNGVVADVETWSLSADTLRDMADAPDDRWSGRLRGVEVPLRGIIGVVEEADVACELIHCRNEIAGFLFRVQRDREREHSLGFGDIPRLVADQISRQLELDADRQAQAMTHQQFRDAAETSFDWFWEMDADFRIVHLSRQWLRVGNIDGASVVGRTFEELGIRTTGSRWGELLRQLRTVGEVHGFGTRVVGPDGRYNYWKINGRAFYGQNGVLLGYRGSCTDVTAEVNERRRAEKAERLLHEAIEALPQGFVLFDEDDHLVVSNQRFRALYPEIAEELTTGADFLDLVQKWAERTPDRSEQTSVEDLVNLRMKAHRARRREFEMSRAGDRAYLVNEQKTTSGSSVWLHTDITAIKARERELAALSEVLRTRNHHFDVTINSISDGLMMLSADSKLILCNDRWRELFNVPEELCREGTDIARLIDHFESSGFAPALGEKYRRKLDSIRDAGKLAYPWKLPDGRTFEVTAVRTEDDGLLVAYRDATLAERQSAVLREQATQFEALSQALAQQNAYFDGALNAMVQALATFDTDDSLIVCNRRFQELFGLPDEFTRKGTTVDRIATFAEGAGLLDDARRKIVGSHRQAREEGTCTVKMRLRDGRAYEVQILLLDNHDVLVTFHEITQMEQHARRLNDYAERLELSNRELAEFAYVASHDLQEPLRKIEAFGDRLRSKHAEKLDENGRAYLERMQHASRRMRALIDDLLDYSRINTKTRPFARVKLKDIVAEVLVDLEIGLEASGGEVRIGELPAIDADATQMRRLFQNLISNAIKFRKPDVAPAVEITAERGVRSRDCTIEVRDNGIGFDNKYAEQIFKIFHRLHGRTEFEGTGIGLAACRKIVERHLGTIRASSVPGVGTTITVCLPLRHLHDEGHRDDGTDQQGDHDPDR